MRKLKYTLLFNELKGNYFIIVITLITIFIINKTKAFLLIIPLIIYLVIIFKKNSKVFISLVVIITIVMINFSTRIIIQNKYANLNYYDGIAKVEKIKKQESSYQITFKIKNVKIIAYNKESLKIGGIYNLKGQITKPSSSHFEGGFDYEAYLKYQNIVGILQIETLEYDHQSFSIYSINNYINNYFDKTYKSKALGMIKALTIGNKESLEDSLSDSISSIGISHLFVISGLHVNIIIMGILFLLKKLPLKEKAQNIIVIITLFIYYLVSGLLISVFRVIYSFILSLINQKYHYNLSSIDLIMINIITILLINPFYIYQYSFILTYLIASGIIICNKFVTSKNKLWASIKMSFLAIMISLPVIVSINPDINFLAIIYNLLYIPFMTYILLPICIITIIIPKIEIIAYYIYLGFKTLTSFFARLSIFTISFPKVSIYFILIYYLVLLILIDKFIKKQKPFKYIIALIIILGCWNNIALFNIHNEVYFLDLPKGEATLIRKHFNTCNILIDTGENGYDDILIFLKKKGIKRLDMIIISHGDSDHNGMLEEIIDNFKVKNIYYGKYDKVTCTKIPPHINSFALAINNTISIAKIDFKVLSPAKDYQNPNDNSLVLYANIFGLKYLFTGDISKKVEETLPLNNQMVDILKVAHHGSKTSTSEKFLKNIGFDKPNTNKIAICMNGYRNQFSFPDSLTVANIKTTLYITSTHKTIIIRKNKIYYK